MSLDIAYLRDLFERRLFDDKAKAQLYDELLEQVSFVRHGSARAFLRPLSADLLPILNRLLQLARRRGRGGG